MGYRRRPRLEISDYKSKVEGLQLCVLFARDFND